jgi:predicted nuclease of predicted toxin-antitoxin system
MQILANENVPGDAVAALRQQGHEVAWVREDAPGSLDTQVLQRAQDEGKVLITFDKDFGELAFRHGLPATCGIILFRISTPSSEYIARLAVAALNQRQDWAGHFSVIDDTQIRMTPLPSSSHQ